MINMGQVEKNQINEENDSSSQILRKKEKDNKPADKVEEIKEDKENANDNNKEYDKQNVTADGEKDISIEPVIRVVLMDTGFVSYGHQSVSGICNGKEFFYTPENVGEGNTIVVDGGEKGFTLTSIERERGFPDYEGVLKIIGKNGSLWLINEVPLETYLTYVVPSEMPSSYEEQALMAQAVCARTYAWKKIEDRESEEYDVDDSVNDQVYGNIEPQSSTTEAVKNTKGQVLCQNGELVQAFYFSTSAGATSTDEIWGALDASPYLKAVECSFDEDASWRNWQVTIPWENLCAQTKLLYGDSEELMSLEIRKKNQSGACTELAVLTENQEYEIKGEYDIRAFLSPRGCTVAEKYGEETPGAKLLPSAYFEMDVYPKDRVEISGKGYGHGVGMSQNAANEMAKEGYSCEEILKYFFRNVEIEKRVQT